MPPALLGFADEDGRFWHEADVKLRPLFGRYWVESGLHWLVMSISAYDPKRTLRDGISAP